MLYTGRTRHYRPAPPLKKTVDVQLHTAFRNENWLTASRLADKRAKTFKDPYYEAVKVCAESQLESAALSSGLLVSLDGLCKQNATPDLEVVELYEWACQNLIGELEYTKTFGLLRSRWVKANPRSSLAIGCLRACLEQWDLVSAQQIAATVDKVLVNSSDRRFMYWNLTLTYLLSLSNQGPESARKIYSALALKQLQRAADMAEATDKLQATDRGLLHEEEFILFYRVLGTSGSKDEFCHQVRQPRVGVISQFRKGSKVPFLEALEVLQAWNEWHLIFDLCLQALRPDDGDDSPSFMAMDCQVWKKFVHAASKAHDVDAAFRAVQDRLKHFVATNASISEMYRKNISIAILETTFHMVPPSAILNSHKTGSSPRVAQLGQFIKQHFTRRSVFDDVRPYISQLTFAEMRHLMSDVLPNMIQETANNADVFRTLECQLRYLASTCPQSLSRCPHIADGEASKPQYQCNFCSRPTPSLCASCLLKNTAAAVKLWKAITYDAAVKGLIPTLDKDPRINLSLVAGFSLLKLAGLQKSTGGSFRSRVEGLNLQKFLQAVLVLDNQLSQTPNDVPLRLILIQLYLMLGCASYAFQLWQPLGVKRTIQDALSPLFFDRISTVAPGLFRGPRPLMGPLSKYFDTSLHAKCPIRIWDAFQMGSYKSILDMADFDGKLRRSCTLVMSVLEGRNAQRAYGGDLDDVMDNPLIEGVVDETEFVNATDYGSYPNLESPDNAHIQEYLRLGPSLSNERSHLGLLTEQYLDLLSFVPPKEYQPANTNDTSVADRAYIEETLAHLDKSLAEFLRLPNLVDKLTGSEETYISVISLLCSLLLIALATPCSDPVPETVFLLMSTTKSVFGSLRMECLALTPTPPAMPLADVFWSMTDMHNVFYLRATALAIKKTVLFAHGFHDREQARKASVHKDIIAEMKGLEVLAGRALGDLSGGIKYLKAQLAEPGWLDRLLEWTLGSQEEEAQGKGTESVAELVGGLTGAEEWAGKVLESWRDSAEGWSMVQTE